MRIRDCTAEDLGRVCELLAPLWPDLDVNTAEMRRAFERGLEAPNQKFLCAVLDDEIVGFCSLNLKNNLWQQGFVGHVDELVVAEPHRRAGIGSALIRRIEEIARRMGCKRLELDSAHHRAEAHAFYESRGFRNRAILFSKPIATTETRHAADR
jgi:GNAT superfamily N-acetyltransferase